jgi:hypothetical protein
MSDPINASKVAPLSALQDALCEIISAQSSLNMPPDPIAPEPSTVPLHRPLFVSETDGNAAHSIEHMRAAFALVRKGAQAQEALKTQVYRLVVQLKEAGIEPKVKTWLDADDGEVTPAAREPVSSCGRCGHEYTGEDCPRCYP